MKICTWVNCENKAIIDEKAKDGKVWASLCVKHSELLNMVLEDGDNRMIIATWIKAQGGAEKAVKRVIGDK